MSTPRYRSAPPARSGSAISVAKATTPSRPDWTSVVTLMRAGSWDGSKRERNRLRFRAVNELLFRPASELAGLIRSGELSAGELVEASLRRIDELQPAINAFTHVAHESALATARAIG